MSGAYKYLLGAGDLQAEFLPGAGMLGASLTLAGTELLRRVENLEAARVKGSTAGIPLLYPWANRLSGLQYLAAGREVSLDSSSALLHFDDHGLPMHGVPWGQLQWDVISSGADTLTARLDWVSEELLEDFSVSASCGDGGAAATPWFEYSDYGLCRFGFSSSDQFWVSSVFRASWYRAGRVATERAAMSKLSLDAQGIPTGAETPTMPFAGLLGNTGYDDGFALPGEQTTFFDRGKRVLNRRRVRERVPVRADFCAEG